MLGLKFKSNYEEQKNLEVIFQLYQYVKIYVFVFTFTNILTS